VNNQMPVPTDFAKLVEEIPTERRKNAAHDLMKQLDTALTAVASLQKSSVALLAETTELKQKVLQLEAHNALLKEQLRSHEFTSTL
jgi:urocanate hydratase